MRPCANSHPLNRLRPNRDLSLPPQPGDLPDTDRLVCCQDCGELFDMAIILGWDKPINQQPKDAPARLWRLTNAMQDKSGDKSHLAGFLPAGVTLEMAQWDYAPVQRQAAVAALLALAPATAIPLTYENEERDPAWSRPGSARDARR